MFKLSDLRDRHAVPMTEVSEALRALADDSGSPLACGGTVRACATLSHKTFVVGFLKECERAGKGRGSSPFADSCEGAVGAVNPPPPPASMGRK